LQKSGIELAVIVLRALIMIAATGETVHTSLKYGHVEYTICKKKQQISTVKKLEFYNIVYAAVADP